MSPQFEAVVVLALLGYGLYEHSGRWGRRLGGPIGGGAVYFAIQIVTQALS